MSPADQNRSSSSTDGLDKVNQQFVSIDDLWNSNNVEANNSEDSSLSDSDKTIMNEEPNDVNSELLENEVQKFISTEGLDVQQPYFNKITNGDHSISEKICKINQLEKENRK